MVKRDQIKMRIKFSSILFTFVTLSLSSGLGVSVLKKFPKPFFRELKITNPPIFGNDVILLQNLIARSEYVHIDYSFNGYFDELTSAALIMFQKGEKIPSVSGNLDVETANIIVKKLIYDNYTDVNGSLPSPYLYKIYIPVHKNRSLETIATLFDRKGTTLLNFKVRTHGRNDDDGKALNQLSSGGSTPTGLSEIDLNSPEDDPISYGPYPINRFVRGIKGNQGILGAGKTFISDIRDGILLHTGEWPNWNESLPMPNSHGCVHAHPNDILQIWKLLVSIGVEVHKNTFGKLPYPYQPQGLVSIEQLDD